MKNKKHARLGKKSLMLTYPQSYLNPQMGKKETMTRFKNFGLCYKCLTTPNYKIGLRFNSIFG